MDFIGSKINLNEWMFNVIKSVASPGAVFMDGCSGSGAVSRYAAREGYHVVSNDLMKFPQILANGSIGLTDPQKKQVTKDIDILNGLGGKEGFFYDNFTRPSKYFTETNARRVDGIRCAIELVSDSKIRDCLLYHGLEALSRASNTAGTHGA